MTIGCEIVGREALQSCPAAVRLFGDRATLLLNATVLRRYTPYERRFVVAHEMGHLLMKTADERVADAFALGLLAGTERDSLRASLRTLEKVDIPPARLQRLLHLAIGIDNSIPNAPIDYII